MTTENPERPIGKAVPADADAISETLALAFFDDPVFQWLFPDSTGRKQRMDAMFKLMFHYDVKHGYIRKSPDCHATSFWRSPGTAEIPTLSVIPMLIPLLAIYRSSFGKMLNLTNAIKHNLPKGRPFYYVHFVGVRPDDQHQGWGTAMMKDGIAKADAEGVAVYLETALESNVTFYQHLGFTVTGEWHIKDGPKMWSMLREPG
ncbi:GNAT family N-acetyltransferase [Pontixanthobacter gangjinensis]|uniref:GNAT family N-acetyltransferase n=1 Tax=Pontixanthobacter gangjinensis TaxID=1028742 RepID=A0A6I4SLW4_9SPHN|nr:GNAT family N-acetyltransferase [Pontixanthobacter gangjinensis]MXO56146.1 GNAT family N-acetyltransferase [Pontixanthobacter gangjinensis]